MANPIDVQSYLGGVTYPCDKQELIRYAKEKGADKRVINALNSLPDQEYGSPIDVSSELNESGIDEGIEPEEEM